MRRRVLVGLAVVLATALAPPSALAIAPSGSFVQVTGTAPIYVVVGGALIHVDSCAPLGGCPGVEHVSTLAGYAAIPADGSFVRIQNGPNSGFIGVVVGGAVVHVDSCAPLAGCAGDVGLDAGGAADYMAAHPVPANGSFIRIQDGPSYGFIGVVVGGAIIHVDSCAYLPCITVGLDAGGAADYMAAHPAPADGSFVRVADGPAAGLIAEAAGGAFLPISSCAPLNGCQGWVSIDSGGLADYVRAHPLPADGTMLRALPSGTLWVMLDGERVPSATSVGTAVAVDDASLAEIPMATPAGTGIATTNPAPPTKRRRALAVRLALRWQWNRRRTQLLGVTLGHHPRGVRVSVGCRGQGCPIRVREATFRRVARLRDAMDGGVYHAGDRVTITLTARGYRRERVTVKIRDGRIPEVRLV